MSGSLSDTNLSSVYRAWDNSEFLPASSILHAALGEAIGASEENLGEEAGNKEDEALGDEDGKSEEKALGDEFGNNEDDALGEEVENMSDALGDEDGNKEEALGDEVGNKPDARGEAGGIWEEARRFEKFLESSLEGCLGFKDSPQHEHLSVSTIALSFLLLSVSFFSEGLANIFWSLLWLSEADSFSVDKERRQPSHMVRISDSFLWTWQYAKDDMSFLWESHMESL